METEGRIPDSRGPAIVVTGSVLDGFKFYGPFDSIDAAVEWYAKSFLGTVGVNITICLLQPPTSP